MAPTDNTPLLQEYLENVNKNDTPIIKQSQ